MITDILYIMTVIFAAFFVCVVVIIAALFPAVTIIGTVVIAILYIRYKGNYS